VFAPSSWETLPEFVAATRFAWLSDWLRRDDREMVEMEVAYIQLLMNHRQSLANRWA
jgi:homoserine kinase type II